MIKAKHNSHTFSVNFIGAFGYVSTLLVWLLVFTAIIQIFALQTILTDASNPLYSILPSPVSQPLDPQSSQLQFVNFLLVGVLLVVIWMLVHLGSRLGIKIIRHFLRLFGKKVTVNAVIRAKYFWLGAGLVLLVLSLLFIPNALVYLKMPLALIGFTAGSIGVGSIWVQSVLAVRYRVTVDDLV